MKKELFIYSLAIGINRGASLIFMPVLIHSLTTGEYGVYTYIQLLFQIFFPLLSLNITSGIAREGAEIPSFGKYIYKKFAPYIFLSTVVFAGISFFFAGKLDYERIIFYTIVLGGVEALHNMQLSVFRTYERHIVYFIFTFIKTIGFLVILLLLHFYSKLSLYTVLNIQVGWNLIVLLAFSFKVKSLPSQAQQRNWKYKMKPVLIFSLLLIPHGISQWLINASSRIWIKSILGVTSLGIFGISYSLASFFILINSGLAIVLPQNFIKNPKYWLTKTAKNKFFFVFSVLFLLVFFAVLIGAYLNDKYYTFLKIPNPKLVIMLFAILSYSIYFLGYYYYYANILFYHKKAKLLSQVTLSISILTFAGGWFFITKYGLIGGAISNAISYLFYYISLAMVTSKVEKELRFSFISDVLFPIIVGVLFSVGVLVFQNA